MDKNPKRRKYRENPYKLSKDESKNLYIVTFRDTSGIIQEIEVTKEVWEVFDEYEKIDISLDDLTGEYIKIAWKNELTKK